MGSVVPTPCSGISVSSPGIAAVDVSGTDVVEDSSVTVDNSGVAVEVGMSTEVGVSTGMGVSAGVGVPALITNWVRPSGSTTLDTTILPRDSITIGDPPSTNKAC